MSQEPEKEIEKQLREHAETRRAAAGGQTELHPATRAMLQGEVTRTYGTQPVVPQERNRKPWWAYWPGLLFGSCCVLLLAVFMMPGQQKLGDLAETTETLSSPSPTMAPVSAQPAAPSFDAAAMAVPPAQPPPAVESLSFQAQDPTPQATASSRQQKTLESTPVPAEPESRVLTAPTPMVASPSGGARSSGRLSVAKTEAETVSQSAPAAPANTMIAPAATPAPSISAATLELQDSAKPLAKAKKAVAAGAAPPAPDALSIANPATGQLFEQSPSRSGMRRNFQSPASPEVLEQFRVQQNGAELRFVDSDGSVYVGNMITAGEKAMAEGNRSGQLKDAYEERSGAGAVKQMNEAVTSRAVVAEAENAYYFRATGMNRSLNQPVVIDGTFKNAVTWESNRNRLDAARKIPEQNTNTLQLLIQGRATVGDRQELIINAVPVNR